MDLMPALTEDQWERLRAHALRHYYHDTPEWVLTAYLELDSSDRTRLGLPAFNPVSATPEILVALANAALPDGHPGKLTADDAAAVRVASTKLVIENGIIEHPMTIDETRALAVTLSRVAQKLAALFPPTPERTNGGTREEH